MKRLVVTLTIALSFFTLSSFATSNGNISEAAVKSFENSFKNATEITWTINSDYYKVAFALNGQYINAYYRADGKMIALTRNISSTGLPLTLQNSLRTTYSDYWISDLFEMADEGGITSYYATIENGENKIVLKSSLAEWNVYQKARKL